MIINLKLAGGWTILWFKPWFGIPKVVRRIMCWMKRGFIPSGTPGISWRDAVSLGTGLIFMFWLFAYLPAFIVSLMATVPGVSLLFSSPETWPASTANMQLRRDQSELLNWCLNFSHPKLMLLVLQTSLLWTTLVHFLLLTIHEWLAKILGVDSFAQAEPTTLLVRIALKLRLIPKRE